MRTRAVDTKPNILHNRNVMEVYLYSDSGLRDLETHLWDICKSTATCYEIMKHNATLCPFPHSTSLKQTVQDAALATRGNHGPRLISTVYCSLCVLGIINRRDTLAPTQVSLYSTPQRFRSRWLYFKEGKYCNKVKKYIKKEAKLKAEKNGKKSWKHNKRKGTEWSKEQ